MATKAQWWYRQLLRAHRPAVLFEMADSLWWWDQRVTMPRQAARCHPEIMAALEELCHNIFTSPAMERIFSGLMPHLGDLSPEKQAAVRLLYSCFQRAKAVPADLVRQFAEVRGQVYEVYRVAKGKGDFKAVLPYLVKMVEMARQRADLIGYDTEPYDALLPDFEPGMTATRMATILEPVREHSVALLQELRGGQAPPAMLQQGYWPVEAQRRFCQEVARRIGFSGRLDESVHPCTITVAPDDVRLTTHFKTGDFNYGFKATTHEAGHGFLQLRRAADLVWLGPTSGGGRSSGIHESCSRLWENQIGKSLPFCEWIWPLLCQTHPVFVERKLEPEDLYRMLNRVEMEEPFVRTEADEVTYNLHIVLRFELEVALIRGAIKPAELPYLWDEKMKQYLGVRPPSYTVGVLQDVHWPDGYFGYFPSYTNGNLLAAVWWAEIRRAIPDVDDQIQKGQFGAIQKWLQENVYRWGLAFSIDEQSQRVTGQPFVVEPWQRHLNEKYRAIYQV